GAHSDDKYTLQEHPVEGVDRLLIHASNSLAEHRNQDPTYAAALVSGFFNEAAVAIKLMKSGYQVDHIDADSFDGSFFCSSPGKSLLRDVTKREVDLIVRRDGRLYFIEVKSSIGAFVTKNSRLDNSQVQALQTLALAHDATPIVVIVDTKDFYRYKNAIAKI